MRRGCGRDESDLVEPALLASAFGQEEVAVVDRVEGAAKNTYTHVHNRDSDRHGLSPARRVSIFQNPQS
jgi:hypothetical protein